MLLILGAAIAVQGQQTGGATQPAPTAGSGNTVVDQRNRGETGNTVIDEQNRRGIRPNNPDGRAFSVSNPPPGRPFRVFSTNNTSFTTNNTRFAPADTNGFPPNQQFPPPNQQQSMQAGAESSNSFAMNMTNGALGSSQTINATITNTLSTMSPAQANNVIQVQAGLNALQQIAISLGGVQNVQQIVQQNPQVQEQLQKIQAQITTLAQGQVRPSSDIVSRLSEDLLRVNARAQLSPNQLLVLAIVINQACNSTDMSPTQIEGAINTALANMDSAGAPRAVSHLVGCDLHSIAFQLQPNLVIQ